MAFPFHTDFLNRARARTTSEMMEVDDKIMPLPNFRIKPKKWKSREDWFSLSLSLSLSRTHF